MLVKTRADVQICLRYDKQTAELRFLLQCFLTDFRSSLNSSVVARQSPLSFTITEKRLLQTFVGNRSWNSASTKFKVIMSLYLWLIIGRKKHGISQVCVQLRITEYLITFSTTFQM